MFTYFHLRLHALYKYITVSHVSKDKNRIKIQKTKIDNKKRESVAISQNLLWENLLWESLAGNKSRRKLNTTVHLSTKRLLKDFNMKHSWY